MKLQYFIILIPNKRSLVNFIVVKIKMVFFLYFSVQVIAAKSVVLPATTKPFSIACNVTYTNELPTIIW